MDRKCSNRGSSMNQERQAKEYNRIYKFAESLGIDNLANPEDEPNLELAEYLEALEHRITNIEARLERNFHILTQ